MPNNNKQQKTAGCLTAFFTVILMLAGMLCMVCSVKSGGNNALLIVGLVLFMLPLAAIPLIALLPEKIRGVDKTPRKQRACQIFMILGIAAFIMGFLTALSTVFIETDSLTLIVIGVLAAAAGFIMMMVSNAVNKKLTGNKTVEIQLFPEDDTGKEIAGAVLDNVLKKNENSLTEEERERELARIEQQDRMNGAGMTREQVEEYENRKRGG